MKPPVIAKSGAEIAVETQRLIRLLDAYEAWSRTQPDSDRIGQRAIGGRYALDWVLGQGPALSETLERAFKCMRQPQRGRRYQRRPVASGGKNEGGSA